LTGSVLLAYAGRGSAEEPPFIQSAGNNASIAGLIVAYPDWKQTDEPTEGNNTKSGTSPHHEIPHHLLRF
jgi:hypothetical protein